MIAYLVVREGTKWRDVHRLTAGQVMSIGRAPANRVVLRHNWFGATLSLGSPGTVAHEVKHNDILNGISIPSGPTPDISYNWWGHNINAISLPFCPNIPAPPIPPWDYGYGQVYPGG